MRISIASFVTTIALTLFLSSCTTFVSISKKSDHPNNKLAYLAGAFHGTGAYGLTIQNIDTGVKSEINLDSGPIIFGRVDENFVIYPFSPGNYKVIAWFRYDKSFGLDQKVSEPKPLNGTTFDNSFKLSEGEIAMLGRLDLFVEKVEGRPNLERFGFNLKEITRKETYDLKSTFYPNFSEINIECIFCPAGTY